VFKTGKNELGDTQCRNTTGNLDISDILEKEKFLDEV